jgi:hypothetical protein
MNWYDSCLVEGIPQIKCLPELFSRLTYFAFLFAGTAAVALIIWGGIKYVRSGGDQKQVQSARQTITFAILGLIIILSSVFIIQFISNLTGTDCITRFGFNNCQ